MELKLKFYTKMNIEEEDSNQLKNSYSTQASNNMKSIVESKNLNLNICNTNTIFFPEKNNAQQEKVEKEIFTFNFKSKEIQQKYEAEELKLKEKINYLKKLQSEVGEYTLNKYKIKNEISKLKNRIEKAQKERKVFQ